MTAPPPVPPSLGPDATDAGAAMSDRPYDRPVALVLAGSRGMGRGSALALAARGARVAITGRNEDSLASTAAELGDLGADPVRVVSDVSDPTDLDAAFQAVDEAYGRLDVLVANAGSPARGPFLDLPDASWEAAYELTLMSVVRSVSSALDRFGDAGRIVIIGSSSVRRPIPNLTISNALRPALNGLVKHLAVELAPRGVTVNMVSPGRVDTGHARNSDERRAERRGVSYETVRAEYEASIPMGRYGTGEEFGELVAFLASPDAGYVTGQSLLVDGGLVPTLP
jgi:3-oxoacyl-[acyl-carrier protein] reductase